MRLLVVSPLAAGTLEFLAGDGMAEDEGPAARPGVAAARPIGEKLHFGVVSRRFFGHVESGGHVRSRGVYFVCSRWCDRSPSGLPRNSS